MRGRPADLTWSRPPIQGFPPPAGHRPLRRLTVRDRVIDVAHPALAETAGAGQDRERDPSMPTHPAPAGVLQMSSGGRSVKKIINDPSTVVDEALAGMALAHPDLITVHTDENEDVDRAKHIFKTAGAQDISTVSEASAPKV